MHHVQLMQQVLAKLVLTARAPEVQRRGDHTHVDARRQLPADAMNSPREYCSSHVGSVGDMSPISSRKSVLPSACSNRPRLSPVSPVRAFSPEQFDRAGLR
jgi:hypothetical protein